MKIIMLRSIQEETNKLKEILINLEEPMEISIVKNAYQKVEGLNTIIKSLVEENNLFLYENTLYSRKYLIEMGVEVPDQKEIKQKKIDIDLSKVFSKKTGKQLNKHIKKYEKYHILSIENSSYIISD